jgi:hypothetical protein
MSMLRLISNAVSALVRGVSGHQKTEQAFDHDLTANGWPSRDRVSLRRDKPNSGTANSPHRQAGTDASGRRRILEGNPKTSTTNRAVAGGASRNKNTARTFDHDLTSNGWRSQDRGSTRGSGHGNRIGTSSISRVATDTTDQPTSFDKNLALALALSAIEKNLALEGSNRQLDISIGPSRDPNKDDINLALALAYSVLENQPLLNDSKLQFDVLVRPSRSQYTDEENLALAQAYSVIDSVPELKNSGLPFDVRIRPSLVPTTEKEDLALALVLSAIENEPSLKQCRFQIDVRSGPAHDQKTFEENLSKAVALSLRE